jgi:hypothetical protein
LVTVSTYGVLEYTPDEAPTSNSTWYRVGLVNGRNVFNSSVYIRLTATGGASTADIDANPSETALESLRPAYGIPQTLAGTFTYATLPAASANTARTAYTSDQGAVWSDGTNWRKPPTLTRAATPLTFTVMGDSITANNIPNQNFQTITAAQLYASLLRPQCISGYGVHAALRAK